MSEYQSLRWDLDDGVLTVTMNRPDRLNALDTAAMNELTHAFTRADRDDAVRAVIVTWAGQAFCAGGDLSPRGATFDAVAQRRATSAKDHIETGGPLAMSVFTSRKPFIAALNGAAAGVGARRHRRPAPGAGHRLRGVLAVPARPRHPAAAGDGPAAAGRGEPARPGRRLRAAGAGPGGQVTGRDGGQAAAVLADRGPDGGQDEYVFHWFPSSHVSRQPLAARV